MRAIAGFLAASLLLPRVLLAGETPGPKESEETLEERIEGWVTLLGSELWEERERASEALVRIGELAIPALDEACRSADIEVRIRASAALSRILKTLRIADRVTKEGLIQTIRGLASASAQRRKVAWKVIASASNLANLAKD